MRPWRGLLPALAVLLTAYVGPAGAVTGFDAAPPPAAADDPYAAGVAAFEREDWQGVLDQMSQALEARPWLDNAHNLMGFAYRKLGDYPAALEAYDRALTLNPYNRGALEYLGEAYLEVDRPDDAWETLDRLAEACRRLAHGAVDPLAACEEWQDLSEAYEAYLAKDRSARAE
ncbi:MAG TPA: tetratricopeptide repeat protein [Geminicoccaceae bacterium]|nr:tetratricopeptide repeat protein [Geminicoccaceae bacterium]